MAAEEEEEERKMKKKEEGEVEGEKVWLELKAVPSAVTLALRIVALAVRMEEEMKPHCGELAATAGAAVGES